MRQNFGLLTQHVSGTSMPIFRTTIVNSAFWCPNLESRLGCVALGCEMCVLLGECGPTRITFSEQYNLKTLPWPNKIFER
jgi:hypothetical protein